jgi:hypothetical protein
MRTRKTGRRPIAPELWTLIRRMTIENQLWGQRRMQAELTRLGFKVSVRTVAKTALSLPSRQNNMMEDGVPAVMSSRTLIAVLLWLPLPAGDQYIAYKAITCTYEQPALSAEKSSRSISLKAAMCSMLRTSISPVLRTPKSCFASGSPDVCYTISRISGRFDATAMDEPKHMNGSCVPEAEKLKFRG